MRAIQILLLTMVLAACGPIYETNYRYTPPSDPLSRPCISQCLADQSQCHNVAELKAENSRLRCERDAREDYERCLGNASGEQGRASCNRRSCNQEPNLSACGVDYRTCFQSCGGVVDEQRVCTFNCP